MRPDVEYASLHGGWIQLVDALNDKFNYTLGLPMAKALAYMVPGAKVVSFEMPPDWQKQAGDARRFAFAWIPSSESERLETSSRILTVSGEMTAGDWLEQEGYKLDEGVVEAPPGHQDACRCVLAGVVARLPWLRSSFPDAPASWEWEELNEILEGVQEILSGPGSSSALENHAYDERWEVMAQESRFSFGETARLLNEHTPQAAGRLSKNRRV